MPKGVEHCAGRRTREASMQVPLALMPKGVEHHPTDKHGIMSELECPSH